MKMVLHLTKKAISNLFVYSLLKDIISLILNFDVNVLTIIKCINKYLFMICWFEIFRTVWKHKRKGTWWPCPYPTNCGAGVLVSSVHSIMWYIHKQLIPWKCSLEKKFCCGRFLYIFWLEPLMIIINIQFTECDGGE